MRVFTPLWSQTSTGEGNKCNSAAAEEPNAPCVISALLPALTWRSLQRKTPGQLKWVSAAAGCDRKHDLCSSGSRLRSEGKLLKSERAGAELKHESGSLESVPYPGETFCSASAPSYSVALTFLPCCRHAQACTLIPHTHTHTGKSV